MKRTGTKQTDLARFLRMHRVQVSFCLSGRRPWTIDQALDLSLMSGQPVENLLADPSTVRLAKFLSKQPKANGRNTKENVKDA